MVAHEASSTELGPRRRVQVPARPASAPWTRTLSDAYDVAAHALLRAMLWTLDIRSFDPLSADPDLWQDDDDGSRRAA